MEKSYKTLEASDGEVIPPMEVYDSKWLHFEQQWQGPNRKTKLFYIWNCKSAVYLGMIKYDTGFRTYVFGPAHNTIYDVTCLENIIELINLLNNERKQKLQDEKLAPKTD